MDNLTHKQLTPEQQEYLHEMSEQLKAHWEESLHLQKKYAFPPGHLEVHARWVPDDEDADMSEWYALLGDMGVAEAIPVYEYEKLPE